jgi:hypothetical protein
MDRILKTIFAASICVAVFAACNKNAGGAKVNAPRNGKAGEKPVAPGGQGQRVEPDNRGINTSNMSAEEKKKLEETAKDIKTLRALFRDADYLWKEFFPKIIDPLAYKEQNIFKFVFKSLNDRYTDKGVPVKDAACSFGIVEIKKINMAQYDLSWAPCGKKEDSKLVVALTKSSNGWKAIFHVDKMDVKPEIMMGQFMTTIHGTEDSGCDLVPTLWGRLGTLDCTNLGHDTATNKYALIKSLKFMHPVLTTDKDKKPLELEYTLFEKTDSGTEKYTGKAYDNYIKGEFIIDLAENSPPEFVSDTTISKAVQDSKAKFKEDKERLKKEDDERKASGKSTEPAKPEKKPADEATGVSAGVVQQGDNQDQQQQQQQDQRQQDPHQQSQDQQQG